ncbi:MAG: MFS transporter [Actinomycetes bacterium]
MSDSAPAPTQYLRLGEARGRWVLAAAILGTGMAFLDATVVNVALPTLGRDLDADVAGLQWVVNAYTLTLAALILLGGSLGDRLGRRRVFVVGVVWFAIASLLCGLAPNVSLLVVARALQGIGGALLTPGSLAIIQASFHPADRPKAIGIWSGLAGVTTAVGPFVGGYLVDAVSWRWVFLINVPFALAVVLAALRHVPESRDPSATGQFDLGGAGLAALGLGGVTYALIEAPEQGAASPAVLGAGVVGVLSFAAFVLVEVRGRNPMLPTGIFASAQFTAANLTTFAVYGALGGTLFFLVVQLQVVAGFSATAAGVALLPVTVLMLLLSPRAGELAQRIGPRRPMTFGPLVAAVGLLLLLRVGADASYLTDVLPGVVVFGLGLSLTVAPLTATVLGAAPVAHAGIASGVNNAVARAAGLLAVAVLPTAVGLSGDDYQNPAAFTDGYRGATVIGAAMLAVGALLAWTKVRDDVLAQPEPEPAPVEGAPAIPAPRHRHREPACPMQCGIGAPVWDPGTEETATPSR